MAVVSRVEQHDQRTAVVVADLFTDRTPVLSRDVDDHHIGRRPTPGQLQRCADHVDGAFLTEQSEQVDAQPHAPVQDHALPDLRCWHLSSLGWLATSGRSPAGPRFPGEWTPLQVAGAEPEYWIGQPGHSPQTVVTWGPDLEHAVRSDRRRVAPNGEGNARWAAVAMPAPTAVQRFDDRVLGAWPCPCPSPLSGGDPPWPCPCPPGGGCFSSFFGSPGCVPSQ